MKAIADHFPIGEAVVQGVQAGVDLFLVCHAAQRQREGIAALVRAVEQGRISRERLEQSLARNQALARRFAHGPEDGVAALGSAEHRALAQGLWADDFSGADPTER
jgi:beta-N-acetylhexosaminidase